MEPNDTPENMLERRRERKERTGVHHGPALHLGAAAHLAGWPTPMGLASSEGQNRPSTNQTIERTKELLTGWVSPTETDHRRGSRPPRPHDTGIPLTQQVALIAGWTTPQHHDSQGRGSAERLGRHGTKHGCANLQDEVHLTGWPTPTGMPPSRGGLQTTPENARRRIEQGHMLNLDDAVQFATVAGWASPTTRDYKDTEGMAAEAQNPDGSRRNRNDHLPRQAFLLTGWGTPRQTDAERSGYRTIANAEREAARKSGNNDLGTGASLSVPATARFGQSRTPNPAFFRWLMGFPWAWDTSAENSVDWLRWQALMAPLSDAQRISALRAFADMATR